MAVLAETSGQAGRAARLLGAAARSRHDLGAPLPPALQRLHDRTVVAARRALGEPSLDHASALGAGLTPDVVAAEVAALTTAILTGAADAAPIPTWPP